MARAKADAKRPIDAVIPLLSRVIKQTYKMVCYAAQQIYNSRSLPQGSRLAPQIRPLAFAICNMAEHTEVSSSRSTKEVYESRWRKGFEGWERTDAIYLILENSSCSKRLLI